MSAVTGCVKNCCSLPQLTAVCSEFNYSTPGRFVIGRIIILNASVVERFPTYNTCVGIFTGEMHIYIKGLC